MDRGSKKESMIKQMIEDRKKDQGLKKELRIEKKSK